jgi:hypothetical protein
VRQQQFSVTLQDTDMWHPTFLPARPTAYHDLVQNILPYLLHDVSPQIRTHVQFMRDDSAAFSYD